MQLSAAERDKKYDAVIDLFSANYDVYGKLSPSSDVSFPDTLASLPKQNVEAIAQHYGLNTRLLDWSLSPYVAAFFSTTGIDHCKSGNVSIWALDVKAMDGFSKAECYYVRDMYTGNVRNLWQMGSFTRNLTSRPEFVDLFKASSSSYDKKLIGNYPRLIRFDIPLASVDEMSDDLQLMRINSMTIFPGIAGVVDWIKKKSASP